MDSRYLLLVLMSSFALLAFGCQDSGSGGGDDDTYGEDDDASEDEDAA